MKKIILTTYIIGNKNINLGKIPSNVEILNYTNEEDIEKAKGNYISFIDSEDTICNNYFSSILKEIKNNNFDICYINYIINYDYKRPQKIRKEKETIINFIPIYNPYIWNYIFKKEKLIKIKQGKITPDDLQNTSYIPDQIYNHNQNRLATTIISMTTRKLNIHYKNIIYLENYCNGLFNGYITWLIEIGKAFQDFDITLLYTEINDITKKRLSKYFNCIQYNPSKNYTCDRLITTYSTYYYPTNIYCLEESSVFIHGNMSDFVDARKFSEDLYDRYIAVSKTSKRKAMGYFPTNNIEYIYNPYTFDKNEINPHLRLVSAIRNAPEKGINRIKKIAQILDEENIPYTWLIFTDRLEPNQGGLIFREAVTNVIDYIADSDYLVQVSTSEAFSYSINEALCANTKVITTKLPSVRELQIKDGVEGIIIPFCYFRDNNKELLRKKVLEAYQKKDQQINYNYDKSNFSKYNDVFTK